MEKKFKSGLVLGKYYPFTMGHKYLIDTTIEQCDKVHVLVCSLKSEDIYGEIRYNWIKDTYKDNPNVIVHWCQDENPQKPEECSSTDEFYYKYWNPSVYSRIDFLDVVFTSENYGDEFAHYLGVEHVLVDINRKKYKVSGTKVRENPYKMKDNIPNIVKPYYTKKVVMIGPESVGKSTLTKYLSNYFGGNFIEEYGRTYCEKVKPPTEFEQGDFNYIALEHRRLVEESIETTDMVLFVDTEAITTKIFGEMYLNDFNSDMVDLLIDNQSYDLYLLLSPDVPWVDDNTREFPTGRMEHFLRIKKELDERNLPYVIINGESYEERTNSAVLEIKKLLKIIL